MVNLGKGGGKAWEGKWVANGEKLWYNRVCFKLGNGIVWLDMRIATP